MNKTNHDELISSMLDGELTDAQLDAVLLRLKSEDAQQTLSTWHAYQLAGDVLKSDDLAVALSADFSKKFSARLDAEPVILAPKAASNPAKMDDKTTSRYFAITSMAAAVMVAFIMAPQIIPLLKPQAGFDAPMAKVEQTDAFSAPSVKLASNANASSSANANQTEKKELEFAPKLENQVEMLRDPILDSYLLAHQKVSPSFDNGARYVKRANVVSPTDSEK